MNEYRMNVQCEDTVSGETGCFITLAGEHKAISPVFPSLAELYPWMRLNGWKSDEYVGNVFTPWRVSHEVTV